MSFSKEISFRKVGQRPTGGFQCQFCFEDEGLNSEDFVWYVSDALLLRCSTCGDTNEIEEERPFGWGRVAHEQEQLAEGVWD